MNQNHVYLNRFGIPAYPNDYRTRAIITLGLYIFYPLFEVNLCTMTFGLGQYSRAVSNQERVVVVRVRQANMFNFSDLLTFTYVLQSFEQTYIFYLFFIFFLSVCLIWENCLLLNFHEYVVLCIPALCTDVHHLLRTSAIHQEYVFIHFSGRNK